MPKPFESARAISDYLLDRTGRAMKEGDFDAFCDCFAFPLDIQTFQGTSLVRDATALRAIFNAVRTYYAKNGVTDVVRNCLEAEFDGPHSVIATHEARPVRHNVFTQTPYPVLSVLRHDGKDWRIMSCSYAINDRDDHNAALLCAEA